MTFCVFIVIGALSNDDIDDDGDDDGDETPWLIPSNSVGYNGKIHLKNPPQVQLNITFLFC